LAFDYSKLKGRIVEKFDTQQAFSKAIGLSEKSVSDKLNGKKSWKQKEIMKAINVLQIADGEVQDYFFKEKVQNF